MERGRILRTAAYVHTTRGVTSRSSRSAFTAARTALPLRRRVRQRRSLAPGLRGRVEDHDDVEGVHEEHGAVGRGHRRARQGVSRERLSVHVGVAAQSRVEQARERRRVESPGEGSRAGSFVGLDAAGSGASSSEGARRPSGASAAAGRTT